MRMLPLCAAALALATVAPAQLDGSPLPFARLTGFRNTKARNLQEFQGRAVLLEFFMYW